MTVPDRTCAVCEADLAPDALACTLCGAVLGVHGPATQTAKHAPARPTAERVEQTLRRHEFDRARRTMQSIRAIFGVAAIGSLVFLGLRHLSLGAAAYSGLGNCFVMAWLWLTAIASVAGAAFVLRAPLPWTVVAASLWTTNCLALSAIATTLTDAAIHAVFVIGLWVAVGQAARIRAMQAADPNLQLVRERISDRRRVRDGVAEQARDRRRDADSARRRQRLRLFAAIAVLGGIVFTGIAFALRIPAVEPTVERFAAHWRERDVNAIAALFRGGAGSRRAIAFRDAVEQHGWAEALPALSEPQIAHTRHFATATFALRHGEVVVRLDPDKAGWLVTEIELPELQPTDPASAIAAFAKAWTTEGTEALLATVRPKSRDRFGKNVLTLLTNRGWQRQRPQLGTADAARPRNARVQVEFPCAPGSLEVTFEYWAPNWYLFGMKLPDR
ncbi:MAG: hypothetical protein IPK26_09180 [Planctomycetes bacterium]|nr:hypothetical protein [Planctomycetota bacterium]